MVILFSFSAISSGTVPSPEGFYKIFKKCKNICLLRSLHTFLLFYFSYIDSKFYNFQSICLSVYRFIKAQFLYQTDTFIGR